MASLCQLNATPLNNDDNDDDDGDDDDDDGGEALSTEGHPSEQKYHFTAENGMEGIRATGSWCRVKCHNKTEHNRE